MPLAAVIGACAPAAAPPPVVPAPEEVPMPAALPSVPEVRGDLAIDVVYPAEGATIAVRDSTFVFGSTGRGDAALTINGVNVDVAPNGAWLAFLPVPPDGVYNLAATAAGGTVSATRQVNVPPPAQPADATLRIVAGSITPSGPRSGVRGEQVEVRFRGTSGASASLILPDGTTIPMIEREAVDRRTGFMLDRVESATGLSEYVGSFELERTIAAVDPQMDQPTLVADGEYVRALAEQTGAAAVVELARGLEIVQMSIPAALGALEPGRPRVAVAATSRPDSTVIGRRQRGADQAWDFFWPNGTLLTIDGEAEGFYRVRLTPETTAWVVRDDVRLLPDGWPAIRAFVGPSFQVTPRDYGADLSFAVSERVPFRVVPGERGLSIELYGATGRPAYVGYGETDDFIERLDWDQPLDDLFRFDVDLATPLWGYRYRWEGARLIVEIRRPPTVADPTAPLRGLRIAVDAGHRGSPTDIGAIGPTRLTEVEATLAVAQRLVPMLRDAGAEVVEIRTDTAIVPLIDRPILADRSDAHLFVSVHFNAFPDGVNPFENHGTTNFYYWPHSLDLARHMQRELLAELGLPDRGVRFQNLAIPRTPWMPAVLTETLYMMFPEQEAALRDPVVTERIAAAHLRAMEGFVRQRLSEISELEP